MTEVSEQFEVSPEFCEKYVYAKAWPLPRGGGHAPLPDKDDRYDVVVVGAGPSGLFLKLLLARYGLGDESVLCVDPKPRETDLGHADGIHARTMEVLATMGLEHEVVRQGRNFAVHAEWTKTPEGLKRLTQRPFFLSPARFGQLHSLHQGRFERVLSADLRKYVEHGVQYLTSVEKVKIDESDPEYPVVANIRNGDEVREVRSRYLVGADGAHSTVMRDMGIKMEGDIVDEIWGVADFVPESDFPDVRKIVRMMAGDSKLLAMTIPREKMSNGDWLCRVYVDMSENSHDIQSKANVIGDEQREEMRRRKADITREHILAQVAKVYAPYKIRPKPGTVVWWATYGTGQRLADKFHIEDSKQHPRVFLVGDACHTHSPRQGQGLNISIADSYYLSWRLAYVLNDLTPDSTSLLRTYALERRHWAQRVVFADKRWNQEGMPWEQAFQEMRDQVLGCGVEELPSLLVSEENNAVAWQGKDALNGTLRVGRRLFNVRVTRWADGSPWDIHDDFVTDGRYRMMLIASDDFPRGRSRAAVEGLLSLVDEFSNQLVELVVLQPNSEESFVWDDAPAGLKEHAEMRLHCADTKVYETYCVDPKEGAIALVRPDGMVCITTTLEETDKVREMLQRVLKTGLKPPNGTG